ncbi:SdpI family protein [Amycolatopsis sp. CA-230715]|uniref:SdpI family protein n=1 Tax=Amycolatopsis sp. CA-230715 TaxID=2745196 RepID=UPI001C03635D|nr:SdpI family protein [Amycolatopsis sp. CA-230715]
MFVIPLVVILVGLVAALGGFAGWRERLARDSAVGVRTAATLRSDEAFRLGNKVAGLPTMAGGAIAVVGGIAGLVMPTTSGLVIGSVVGLVGLVALVMAGGVLGNKAAENVPAPAPAGCSGCACGAGGCGVASALNRA